MEAEISPTQGAVAPPDLPPDIRSRARLVAVTALLIILASLVVLAGVLLYRAATVEAAARLVVRETYMREALLADLLNAVVDAETGQRGYLLTGDPTYLEPYHLGRQRAEALMDEIERVKEPGTELEARLPTIRSFTDEKLAELSQSVFLFDSDGLEPALDVVEAGRGQALMDQIRDEMAEISAAKEVRRVAAAALADRVQRETTTYLIFLLAVAAVTVAFAGILALRGAQAAERARHLTRVQTERDRADLISRELSHRVKNLFAVILSIISTTARTEPDAREAARKTRERVQALARAHSLSTGQSELRETDLRALVSEIVNPYVPTGRTVRLEGPPVVVPSSSVTPLGLILNELATNALKYGGWSRPEGTVTVHWSLEHVDDQTRLILKWIETGVARPEAGPEERRGFGTTMIDLSAQQANATVQRFWKPEGLELVLDMLHVQQQEGE